MNESKVGQRTREVSENQLFINKYLDRGVAILPSGYYINAKKQLSQELQRNIKSHTVAKMQRELDKLIAAGETVNQDIYNNEDLLYDSFVNAVNAGAAAADKYILSSSEGIAISQAYDQADKAISKIDNTAKDKLKALNDAFLTMWTVAENTGFLKNNKQYLDAKSNIQQGLERLKKLSPAKLEQENFRTFLRNNFQHDFAELIGAALILKALKECNSEFIKYNGTKIGNTDAIIQGLGTGLGSETGFLRSSGGLTDAIFGGISMHIDGFGDITTSLGLNEKWYAQAANYKFKHGGTYKLYQGTTAAENNIRGIIGAMGKKTGSDITTYVLAGTYNAIQIHGAIYHEFMEAISAAFADELLMGPMGEKDFSQMFIANGRVHSIYNIIDKMIATGDFSHIVSIHISYGDQSEFSTFKSNGKLSNWEHHYAVQIAQGISKSHIKAQLHTRVLNSLKI